MRDLTIPLSNDYSLDHSRRDLSIPLQFPESNRTYVRRSAGMSGSVTIDRAALMEERERAYQRELARQGVTPQQSEQAEDLDVVQRLVTKLGGIDKVKEILNATNTSQQTEDEFVDEIIKEIINK
jgi:hypothetical protein